MMAVGFTLPPGYKFFHKTGAKSVHLIGLKGGVLCSPFMSGGFALTEAHVLELDPAPEDAFLRVCSKCMRVENTMNAEADETYGGLPTRCPFTGVYR